MEIIRILIYKYKYYTQIHVGIEPTTRGAKSRTSKLRQRSSQSVEHLMQSFLRKNISILLITREARSKINCLQINMYMTVNFFFLYYTESGELRERLQLTHNIIYTLYNYALHYFYAFSIKYNFKVKVSYICWATNHSQHIQT